MKVFCFLRVCKILEPQILVDMQCLLGAQFNCPILKTIAIEVERYSWNTKIMQKLYVPDKEANDY